MFATGPLRFQRFILRAQVQINDMVIKRGTIAALRQQRVVHGVEHDVHVTRDSVRVTNGIQNLRGCKPCHTQPGVLGDEGPTNHITKQCSVSRSPLKNLRTSSLRTVGLKPRQHTHACVMSAAGDASSFVAASLSPYSEHDDASTVYSSHFCVVTAKTLRPVISLPFYQQQTQLLNPDHTRGRTPTARTNAAATAVACSSESHTMNPSPAVFRLAALMMKIESSGRLRLKSAANNVTITVTTGQAWKNQGGHRNQPDRRLCTTWSTSTVKGSSFNRTTPA
jgi:hypothetical protein